MSVSVRAKQAAARAARERRRRTQIASAIIGLCALAVVFVVSITFGLVGGGSTSSPVGSGSAAGSSARNVFPDFELTATDGKSVDKAALAGKPSIIWFTDTACVPCQLGAVKVRKLAADLGGHPFNVVAVFVNPQETPSMLKSWRDRFGGTDWVVASDTNNELSKRVSLQYLDTKFLLDKNGKILNVNDRPVDDSYMSMLRSTMAA